MTLFLSDDEVAHLTGKRRASAQIRALLAMGIGFERRPDGSPVVLRSAIQPGNDDPAPAKEPQWDAA